MKLRWLLRLLRPLQAMLSEPGAGGANLGPAI